VHTECEASWERAKSILGKLRGGRRRKKDGHRERNVPEVAGIKCPKKLSIFSRRHWKSTRVCISASPRLCLHDTGVYWGRETGALLKVNGFCVNEVVPSRDKNQLC
jgi:hypothetical protein